MNKQGCFPVRTARPRMSLVRLAARSLLFHWRPYSAASAAAGVAAAVLCGALIVGDSMRASLVALSRMRLGNIEAALVAPRFIRAELARELEQLLLNSGTDITGQASTPKHRGVEAVNRWHILPAITLDGVVESADRQRQRRSVRAAIWAVDNPELIFPEAGTFPSTGEDGVVINRTAAHRIGVCAGDTVIVRLPPAEAISSEMVLGRKSRPLQSVRARVERVIPDRDWGRLSLETTQIVRPIVWVARPALCRWLELNDRANVLLAVGNRVSTHIDSNRSSAANDTPNRRETAGVRAASVAETLQSFLRPSWEDCGLQLERSAAGAMIITSDQLIIPPRLEQALLESLRALEIQPALTHLANTIACNDREIPYSTITAVDFVMSPPLGPMRDVAGKPVKPLNDDQIALNRWAAEQLQARVGERVRLSFFEPDVHLGNHRERTAEFTLAAILEMSAPAAERTWTPPVRGITDQLTLGDWDPPFPFDQRRIRPIDDQYWKEFGPTPKAFVSLRAGRKLWAGRLGQTTTLRIAQPSSTGDLAAAIKHPPMQLPAADAGLVFQPIRERALAASRGTTPFEWLFLGFSSFVIISALLLAAAAFRLAAEKRSYELGLLAAVGFSAERVARLLTIEAIIAAAVGSAVGLAAAVIYAELMLWGLRTWWLPAVGTAELELLVQPGRTFGGWLFATAMVAATMYLSVFQLIRRPPRGLLRGTRAAEGATSKILPRRLVIVTTVGGVSVLLLTTIGALQSQSNRPLLFFTAGVAALTTLLAIFHRVVLLGRQIRLDSPTRMPLLRLAIASAARNPGRSLLAAALVSAAVFLIIAVSAFQLDRGQFRIDPNSGNGGFALIAQTIRPIDHDLNSSDGRSQVGLVLPEELLGRTKVYAVRVRSGDDASCLNPYRVRRPRILGIPDRLIHRGGFRFAAASDLRKPWSALSATEAAADTADSAVASTSGRAIPVILDKNTAQYSMHLWKGIGEQFEIDDDRGGRVRLTVAGLLENSIFQGDLLIAEADFIRLFPEESGYRYFLIELANDDTPNTDINAKPQADPIDQIRAAWETSLSDFGIEVVSTSERLASLATVQNTYLAAFRSLGGLGLLLGAVGLAAAQWRSLLERRAEFALMQALGIDSGRLLRTVVLEASFLSFSGCVIGGIAAAIAVLPQAGTESSLPWGTFASLTAGVLLIVAAISRCAMRNTLKSPPWSELRREML